MDGWMDRGELIIERSHTAQTIVVTLQQYCGNIPMLLQYCCNVTTMVCAVWGHPTHTAQNIAAILRQYCNVIATLQQHCNISAILQCCCNVATILIMLLQYSALYGICGKEYRISYARIHFGV